MKIFFRYLHSDFQKIRRSSILWVHILVPIAGIVLFLLSYVIKEQAAGSMVESFLGSMASAFPIAIALVCSMTAEQEADAGNFQGLLTGPSKSLPFFSMTVMLLLLGFGSSLLAVFGFKAGLAIFLHQEPFGMKFYLYGAILIYVSNLFIYMFHLFLSLRFNKNVSIGIGIVESLLSLLLLTGLGDEWWIFIPCSRALRLLKPFFQLGGVIPMNPEIKAAITICCIETVLIFAFVIIWFTRWEGKKTEE